MNTIQFKKKSEQPNCWNCINLAKKYDTPYSCKIGNIITKNTFPEDWCSSWCSSWCKNGIKKEVTSYIEIGYTMNNFNYDIPSDGSLISYLLGNCQNSTVMMATVVFEFDMLNYGGDFAKDENGKFKYVSFWRYIPNL